MNATPDMIYILVAETAGMVKIGASSRPEPRFWVTQAHSPVPLVLAAVAPGTWRHEKALHAMFREHHSHAEWFRMTPEIEAIIARIRSGEALDTIAPTVAKAKGPFRGKRSAESIARSKAHGVTTLRPGIPDTQDSSPPAICTSRSAARQAKTAATHSNVSAYAPPLPMFWDCNGNPASTDVSVTGPWA